MKIQQPQPVKQAISGDMKITAGFCPVCSERFLDERGRPLKNHSQTLVKLTGGHTTHIAICKKCKKSLTNNDWTKVVKSNMKAVAEEIKDKSLAGRIEKMKFSGFKGE